MPNNFNPMQCLQMIKNGQNPQQLMLGYLKQAQSPMGQNLYNLALKGDSRAIEQIARNYCSQMGVDFDTAFNAFRQQLGL